MITTTTWSGSRWRISLQHLHARHAGQHEVEQHQVDLLALQDLERLLAGARRRASCAPPCGCSAVRTSWRTSSSSTIRMFMRRRPASPAVRAAARRRSGAAAGLARDAQVAAVAAHDLVADRRGRGRCRRGRAWSRRRAGRSLQLLGRDAGAAVLHDRARGASPLVRRRASILEPVRPARRVSRHGVDGVEDQVGEHLLQLAVAAAAPRPARPAACQVELDAAACRSAVGEQVERLARSSGARVDRPLLVRPVARELEQVVDDAGGAEGLPLHLLQDLVVRVAPPAVSASSIWA